VLVKFTTLLPLLTNLPILWLSMRPSLASQGVQRRVEVAFAKAIGLHPVENSDIANLYTSAMEAGAEVRSGVRRRRLRAQFC
jgi:hypothetical protein